MKEIDVILFNEEGLHARPASMFTAKATEFESKMIMLKNNDKSLEYNPKSIFSVLSMGAKKGTKLTLIIEGNDEENAAEELEKLVSNNFNI